MVWSEEDIEVLEDLRDDLEECRTVLENALDTAREVFNQSDPDSVKLKISLTLSEIKRLCSEVNHYVETGKA